MSRVLILFFLMLLISPLVSAEIQSLGTFRDNSLITLKQICDNCTFVNITSITYPNSTALSFGQVTMTKVGTDYNYILATNYSSALGKYIVNCFGDLNGVTTTCNYDFEVTPSGATLSTAQGIIYLIASFLTLVIFSLVLFGAIKIEWHNRRDEDGFIIGMNQLKYVKIFLWFMSYALLISLTWLAYNISYGYLSFNVASNIFNFMYSVLIALFYPILVCFMVFSLIIYINDKKLMESLSRGLPTQ